MRFNFYSVKGFLLNLVCVGAVFISEGFTRDWVHPGALSTQVQIDSLLSDIQETHELRVGELEYLQNNFRASRTPNGLDSLDSDGQDAKTSRSDAQGAYTQALLWKLTGDTVYAERAVAILNSWSNLQAFTAGSQQDMLQAGWVGSVFAQSAELMRDYIGWDSVEIQAHQEMYRRAFYPQLLEASTWNGNVDLTQIDALISISVFNEDDSTFQLALDRWRDRSKQYIYLTAEENVEYLENFWSRPTKWVDGLMQETCRDNGHHVQFAIGSALKAAEVAWNQGVDLYGEEEKRYSSALELLASQLLTENMLGTCKDEIASYTRLNTFEIGYNHYHGRMGKELPYTAELIRTQIRGGSERANWNIMYESLTHGSLDYDTLPVLSIDLPEIPVSNRIINSPQNVSSNQVVVYDAHGKEVWGGVLSSANYKDLLSLSGLKPGVYWVIMNGNTFPLTISTAY